MKILRECKAILILLGVSAEKHIPIGNRHIPRLFSRFFIVLALAVCVIFGILFVKQNIKHGTTTILLPAAAAATFFSQIFVYVSLVLKIREIAQLIDYLEHVYNKRNFCPILAIVID